MKLLLIGASGVLGSRLYNDAVIKKWNVLGTYFSHEYKGLFYLDLKDKRNTEKLFNFFDPEVVVLAGGMTNVDLCEAKARIAEEVNIKGTLNIVKRVKERNAIMVYLSTDYVFDGEKGPYKEEDRPSPINTYGRTKLEAEQIVLDMIKNPLIVRTSQIYGYDCLGNNFATKIVLNMKNGKEVFAADDFYSSPTYVGGLSSALISLIERGGISGIFHMAGKDVIDRYSYVTKISEVFGLDRDLIKKVSLKDLCLRAKRPPKGGLAIDKINNFLNLDNIAEIDKGLLLFKNDFERIGYAV